MAGLQTFFIIQEGQRKKDKKTKTKSSFMHYFILLAIPLFRSLLKQMEAEGVETTRKNSL